MPEKRSYKLFVNDIMDAITKIESYIEDLDYDSFAQSNMVIDAVTRKQTLFFEPLSF